MCTNVHILQFGASESALSVKPENTHTKDFEVLFFLSPYTLIDMRRLIWFFTDIDLEVTVVVPRGKALSSALFTFVNSISDCLIEAFSCEMVALKSQQI